MTSHDEYLFSPQRGLYSRQNARGNLCAVYDYLCFVLFLHIFAYNASGHKLELYIYRPHIQKKGNILQKIFHLNFSYIQWVEIY